LNNNKREKISMGERADQLVRFVLTLALTATAYGQLTTLKDLAAVLGIGALIAAIWLWETGGQLQTIPQ